MAPAIITKWLNSRSTRLTICWQTLESALAPGTFGAGVKRPVSDRAWWRAGPLGPRVAPWGILSPYLSMGWAEGPGLEDKWPGSRPTARRGRKAAAREGPLPTGAGRAAVQAAAGGHSHGHTHQVWPPSFLEPCALHTLTWTSQVPELRPQPSARPPWVPLETETPPAWEAREPG